MCSRFVLYSISRANVPNRSREEITCERERCEPRPELRHTRNYGSVQRATPARVGGAAAPTPDGSREPGPTRGGGARVAQRRCLTPRYGPRRAFEVAEFQQRSAAGLMETLQSDVRTCHQRAQRSQALHQAHHAARQRTMGDTKEDLKEALGENIKLAREYSRLQQTLLEARREAACASDRRNRAEDSFHFRTQVGSLHLSRSLYSQAELAHCQALSQETARRVGAAQGDLSEAAGRISAFQRSLTGNRATEPMDSRKE
ncbi:hypothetical protein NHX12_003760, partial [Muraenolepis orangiensis]